MTRLPLLLCLLMASVYLQGQQLSLFTQYRENTTLINPAAVESDFLAYGQNLTFGASVRNQWVGVTGGPKTQSLRGSFISTEWTGVTIQGGGHLINDVTGPTGFTGLYGRIGGVVTGDAEYGGLSIGLSGGIVQYRVDADKVKLREEGDVIGVQDESQLFPDLGFGVYYYQMLGGSMDGDYIYGGISVPQLLGLDLSFQDENGEFQVQRMRHFYGQFGLYKFFRDESFIEPSLWVKYVANAPVNVDFNLRYQLPSSLWIGTGVSTAKNFHIDAGFVLGDNVGFDNLIRIGYGFDYSFSAFGPFAGSTHELNVTFSFER